MYIDMEEAVARFDELMERAQAGERVVITDHGEPTLEMVPYQAGDREAPERINRPSAP